MSTPRLIRQEESHGCAVACAAMLMGCDYTEARRRFVALYSEKRAKSLTDGGITYVELDHLLAEHGIAIARRWRMRDPSDHERTIQPTAPVNLVQGILPGGSHFVLVVDGKVLCPANHVRSLDQFSDIHFIAAVVPVGSAK